MMTVIVNNIEAIRMSLTEVAGSQRPDDTSFHDKTK